MFYIWPIGLRLCFTKNNYFSGIQFSGFDLLNTRVHYGGICIKTGYKCEYKDTIEAKISKILFSSKFIETKCVSGKDFAIVELKKNIEVNIKFLCNFFEKNELKNLF